MYGEGERPSYVYVWRRRDQSASMHMCSRGIRLGERQRESARGVGVAAWRLRGIQTRRGEGRRAEREVAWRGGARSRRARAHPPVEDEDDREGGGLGRLLAGPACCCWAAQGGAPGKLLLFISVFYFFLTFVLI